MYQELQPVLTTAVLIDYFFPILASGNPVQACYYAALP